ncbi:MAG: glycerophosphodiester phosphodiesterase [Ruminococcaceae bacterium]|nr:glycerophosphodiester phosphodiesterase [Oscillospiraceae bacterium]
MKKTFKIVIFIIIAVLIIIAAYGVIEMNELKNAEFNLPANFTYTAHTGCEGTKENSLESIEKGYENGADIVEFDLNFDKSGNPVLCHDEPKGGEVTLDEAFRKVSEYANLKVNVDAKSDLHLEKVKPLAEKYGISDRIFFTGIKDEFVENARKTSVDYYLNIDVENPTKHSEEYLLSLVQRVKEAGAIGINFNKNNASSELVEAFHENGLLVSIWTVDSKTELFEILLLSPDNITTRNPHKIRKIIEDK